VWREREAASGKKSRYRKVGAFTAGAEDPPDEGLKTGPERRVHRAMTATQRNSMTSPFRAGTLICNLQKTGQLRPCRINSYRHKEMGEFSRNPKGAHVLTDPYSRRSPGKETDTFHPPLSAADLCGWTFTQ